MPKMFQKKIFTDFRVKIVYHMCRSDSLSFTLSKF